MRHLAKNKVQSEACIFIKTIREIGKLWHPSPRVSIAGLPSITLSHVVNNTIGRSLYLVNLVLVLVLSLRTELTE